METKKKATKKDKGRHGRERTPEEMAALRARLPEKLNKLGEWFFSEEAKKEYYVVKDWKAVMR
ncbi:MAG: hypothetical protein LUC86_07865 [Prevotellaceae bacterium]|nr:hypothetical protein [Prevotellaceae bacterium]